MFLSRAYSRYSRFFFALERAAIASLSALASGYAAAKAAGASVETPAATLPVASTTAPPALTIASFCDVIVFRRRRPYEATATSFRISSKTGAISRCHLMSISVTSASEVPSPESMRSCPSLIISLRNAGRYSFNSPRTSRISLRESRSNPGSLITALAATIVGPRQVAG